jgi:hypothetical protein
MTVIRQGGFLGENRALHPLILPEGVGTKSLNQKPGRGDFRPWNAPLNKATIPAGRSTIYRMGRDVASDTDYWLSWTTEVHAVRGPNAADTLERTYYTGSGTPKWTDTTKALASAPYPASYRELGIPAPVLPCTLSASGGVSGTIETRFYTYTYVSDNGEESAPATQSQALSCKQDDTVTITSMSGGASVPAGAYGITQIRIYRTQTGASGVGDFYYHSAISSTLSTTTDTGQTLGEPLPTTTWLQPPADLKFLTGMWNGMMAGISGRAVRFCEAYVAYAWPIAYEIVPTDVTPKAMATFGQTLVVLTDGNPFTVTGGSPDAMDEQPVEFLQACVAPLSAVGLGHGVAWASPDGLAYIGSGGARLLTAGVMTREDWQALKPETIKGCMYEGRYFGFYNDGAAKAFMVDPANPQGMYFLDLGRGALYLDEFQNAMYVLSGVDVQKWDAGSPLTATLRTKLHKMPRPMPAFGCAEVVADAYPVTFRLYYDGTLRHTATVADANPFMLPGGFHFQTTQVELATTGAVQGFALAHDMKELAQT